MNEKKEISSTLKPFFKTLLDKDFEFNHSDLLELESNSAWKSFVSDLEQWLEDVRSELEDPDGKTEVSVLRRLGGNAQALRRVLLWPVIAREILTEQEDEKDDSRRDDT